jgi:hypothetical protein
MSGIDDFLNAVIPVAVFIFIFWIFYRIPIIKEGVDRFREWWANRGVKKEEPEKFTLKSISYE